MIFPPERDVASGLHELQSRPVNAKILGEWVGGFAGHRQLSKDFPD